MCAHASIREGTGDPHTSEAHHGQGHALDRRQAGGRGRALDDVVLGEYSPSAPLDVGVDEGGSVDHTLNRVRFDLK
jgi:hypothetical protein